MNPKINLKVIDSTGQTTGGPITLGYDYSVTCSDPLKTLGDTYCPFVPPDDSAKICVGLQDKSSSKIGGIDRPKPSGSIIIDTVHDYYIDNNCPDINNKPSIFHSIKIQLKDSATKKVIKEFPEDGLGLRDYYACYQQNTDLSIKDKMIVAGKDSANIYGVKFSAVIPKFVDNIDNDGKDVKDYTKIGIEKIRPENFRKTYMYPLIMKKSSQVDKKDNLGSCDSCFYFVNNKSKCIYNNPTSKMAKICVRSINNETDSLDGVCDALLNLERQKCLTIIPDKIEGLTDAQVVDCKGKYMVINKYLYGNKEEVNDDIKGINANVQAIDKKLMINLGYASKQEFSTISVSDERPYRVVGDIQSIDGTSPIGIIHNGCRFTVGEDGCGKNTETVPFLGNAIFDTSNLHLNIGDVLTITNFNLVNENRTGTAKLTIKDTPIEGQCEDGLVPASEGSTFRICRVIVNNNNKIIIKSWSDQVIINPCVKDESGGNADG